MEDLYKFQKEWPWFFTYCTIPYDEQGCFNALQAFKYPDECRSLLRKHLTQKVFDQCRGKKTKFGGTLTEVCYDTIVKSDSKVGAHSSDPDGYEVWRPLFDAIIRDYHKVPDDQPVQHPPKDYGLERELAFGHMDKEGKYIISTRVRTARNLANCPFPQLMTRKIRNSVEWTIVDAVKLLPPEYSKGKYYPLGSMTDAQKDKLIHDHLLFRFDDPYKGACGIYRDWPEGRGIYMNDARTFLIWVNEGDQYRIISMERGGNLARVYKRLFEGVRLLEQEIQFAWSQRLGNISFCPTNLGTSMRASVHIRLPLLSKHDKSMIQEVADKHHLQIRGTQGELSEADADVYDLSNKRRLGLTETELANGMAQGASELIKLEQELEKT